MTGSGLGTSNRQWNSFVPFFDSRNVSALHLFKCQPLILIEHLFVYTQAHTHRYIYRVIWCNLAGHLWHWTTCADMHLGDCCTRFPPVMIPWPFPRSLVEKLSEWLVMSWRWSLAKLRKRCSGISIHAVKTLLDTSGEKTMHLQRLEIYSFYFVPSANIPIPKLCPPPHKKKNVSSFNSLKTPNTKKKPISNILRVKSPTHLAVLATKLAKAERYDASRAASTSSNK